VDVIRKPVGENCEEVAFGNRLFRVYPSPAGSSERWIGHCEVFEGRWDADEERRPDAWRTFEITATRQSPEECLEAAVADLVARLENPPSRILPE
jgi:hypothetical protein